MGGKVAHGLLAYELQLLLELLGSFSSWAGDIVGPEQVIQQELSSHQQKVRLHSNNARLHSNSAWRPRKLARRPRKLLASQQSVHLIHSSHCVVPMYSCTNVAVPEQSLQRSFDSRSKHVHSRSMLVSSENQQVLSWNTTLPLDTMLCWRCQQVSCDQMQFQLF